MQAPPPPQQPHHQAPQHYPGHHFMSSSSSSSGKTPIAKRTRSSRVNNSQNQNNNNYSNDAPPPPPSGYGQQYNHQYNQQPPQTTVSVMMRNTADDAIAKRRAELRRLQQQRGKSSVITERLALATAAVPSHRTTTTTAAAASSASRGGANNMTVHNTDRNAVVVINSGGQHSRYTAGNNNIISSSSHQRVSNNNNTVRRLDDSYNNNNITSSSGSGSGSPIINGIAAPQPPPIMAVKRTSEIFPSKRVSSSSVGPTGGGPSPPTAAMARGMSSTTYQPVPPPQQQQQQPQPSSSSQYTQPPPTFQQQQLQVPMTSATTTNIISNNNYNSSANTVQTKSSPFGQARVLKSTTPVKSLVPPLTMLMDSPPHLLNENNTDDDESSSRVEEVKKSGVVAAVPPVVVDTISTATAAEAATPRMDEIGVEMINSGQSTPVHINHVDESPLNAASGFGGAGGGDVERKQETLPDFNVTLHEAKIALKQQQQEEQQGTKSTADADSKKEEEVENQPPQSKKETHKYDEGDQQHEDNGNNDNDSSNKGNNLSQLKLDLQRSEQEKRKALEQVAKLKSLLEAGGIGKRSVTAGDDDQTPRMMTTINNNTTPSKRPPGHNNNIMTPRGGNTPNRYTPGRNRVGVPPLAWNSPRSGNSRAGSRVGSPEHHHHHHPFNPSGGGGTPRVRASPLPKQLNRVVSDTQLSNKVTGESNGNGDVDVPQEERVEEEFLVAAARSIPNEYGTTLASYFVRRPHITDDSLEKENEADELAKVASNLWGTCTHLSSRTDYMKHASVFNPESLEIVACIEADGSVFTLSGECNVRHGKVSSGSNGDDGNKGYDWSVFDNVEEMDRALGRVSYIDVEGNEREYWLDSIYEEALTTRESYCTSMISAAFILKEVKGPLGQKREQYASLNQTMPPVQPAPMQSFVPPTKPSLDASFSVPQSNANVTQQRQSSQPSFSKVEMEPTKSTTNDRPVSETAVNSDRSKDTTKQKSAPPTEEYEPSDSALTIMVVYLFSLFFKLTWMIIKTPFRIGSMIFTFWITIVTLRVLWLFLADDNGAFDIGAGVEYEYNMPGIY